MNKKIVQSLTVQSFVKKEIKKRKLDDLVLLFFDPFDSIDSVDPKVNATLKHLKCDLKSRSNKIVKTISKWKGNKMQKKEN